MRLLHVLLLLLIGIVCWFDLAVALDVLPQLDNYYRDLPPGTLPARSIHIANTVTRYVYVIIPLAGVLALGLHYRLRRDHAKTWALVCILVLVCALGGITFQAQMDLPWDIGFGVH